MDIFWNNTITVSCSTHLILIVRLDICDIHLASKLLHSPMLLHQFNPPPGYVVSPEHTLHAPTHATCTDTRYMHLSHLTDLILPYKITLL